MEILERLRTTLADRYAIERELGAGGMATVYLARDLRHNRHVALKVLHPELSAVLGPERFLKEIEITASLQHPHILPLFDSGAAAGLLFYVMPYVEGESLRRRLERAGPLPVAEAIRLTTEVAGALEYAHGRGLIHRDIKPENILLQQGQAMLSDFGIALAVQTAGAGRMTQTGLSLGTPQYMAPEQVMGERSVDVRADVYALGAVTYEMLAGEAPFTGPSSPAILSRVLTEKPRRLRTTRSNLPEHLEAAVEQALEKLPADRWQSAREFAAALADARLAPRLVGDGEAAGRSRRASQTGGLGGRLSWLVTAAALLLAILIGWKTWQSTPGVPIPFVLSFGDTLLPAAANGPAVAISDDGTQFAFVGIKDGTVGIYVRRLNQLNATLVRGTQGGETPEFSPDGRSIIFVADGGLKRIPLTGGSPVTITDEEVYQRSWTSEGELIYRRDYSLWRHREGAAPLLLAHPDTAHDHVAYGWPEVLPGDDAALITLWRDTIALGNTELALVDLESGEVTELDLEGTSPHYLSTGHIVFGRPDGSVVAAPFSLRQRTVTGPAVPVLEEVVVKTGGAVDLAVSPQGTLLYKTGKSGSKYALLAVDRSGTAREFETDGRRPFYAPRVSPNGGLIAVSISQDIWVYDTASTALTRLTSDGRSWKPEWSPDGRRIAFTRAIPTAVEEVVPIRWVPWDGSGAAEDIIVGHPAYEVSFGAKGFVAARMGVDSERGEDNADIWIAPLDSLQSLRPYLTTAADEILPRVAPDGSLLAYASNESDVMEVYIRPIPGYGPRVPVSVGGGSEPVWSSTGTELFYRSPSHLMSATVVRTPELTVIRRDTLFADPYVRDDRRANYDVFPGGHEFVVVQRGATDGELIAVLNWTEEMRRLLQE